MRKLMWITLCLAAIVVTTATASGQREQQTETRTIDYLAVNPGDSDTRTRIIMELSQEYTRANPGVRVELESVLQTNIMQRVQLLSATGSLPDVFEFESGRPLVELIEADLVMDVEQAFTEVGIADRMNPGVVALLKRLVGDRGLYAIPTQLNVEGFWYNKSIFEDLGLTVPTTWEEMIEAADVIMENGDGVQPFAVAGRERWPATRLLNAYIIRTYGVDAMDRAVAGDLSMNSDGFVEAARQLQNMNRNGYFGRGVNTIDYGTALDTFLQGGAAMYYMGSWVLGDFNNPQRNMIGEDAIGYFNIPLVTGGEGVGGDFSINAGTTMSISKARYDEQVGDWLRYVFSNYADSAMEKLGIISGFRVDRLPDDISPLTEMTLEVLDNVENGALWFEAGFDVRTKQLAEDNVQRLLAGEMTPEAYMSALENSLRAQR